MKKLPMVASALSLLLLPSLVAAQPMNEGGKEKMISTGLKARIEARVEHKKEKEIKKIEHVITGKVTAINGLNLTLLAKKGTYTVDISGAKLVRRFGAKMLASEIQVNDELFVNGTVSSSTSTTVTAKMVRDNSLQARNGTFEGTVSALTANGFTVSTKNRKDQSITLTASTTFSKDGKAAALTDVMSGSRVVVHGVWNRPNAQVTAKSVRIIIETKRLSGMISAVSGTTLTVTGTKPSSTFSVDISSAKLLRRFGGSALITDLKVGDKVEIQAKQATQTAPLLAVWVRDLSLAASTTVSSSVK